MLQHDCELSEDVKITQPLVRIKQDPEADAVIKHEHDEQVTLVYTKKLYTFNITRFFSRFLQAVQNIS